PSSDESECSNLDAHGLNSCRAASTGETVIGDALNGFGRGLLQRRPKGVASPRPTTPQNRVRIDPEELCAEVGDGANREGGISWGCLTTSLLHRRSNMPCQTITLSS